MHLEDNLLAPLVEMAHAGYAPDPAQFEIAFLCVLLEERNAIALALDGQYERSGIVYPRGSGDTNAYTTGWIGNHDVVIVYLPGVGNIGSAAAAASIPRTFPGIKLAIVVGVCGVNPHARNNDGQEVVLGDVVVSTTVLRSSYGHQYSDAFSLGREEDTLRLAPVAIRTFLQQLETIIVIQNLEQKTALYSEKILDRGLRPRGQYPGPENDILFDPEYRHKHWVEDECETCAHCQHRTHQVCSRALRAPCAELGCDMRYLVPRQRLRLASGFHPDGTPIRDRGQVECARQPSIWFGKFASGESVMKSAYHRDQLVEQHGVMGFEMEGAGSWDYIPTIIVKGACDYADSHKNKVWQQYSAITAAACARAIVEQWRSDSVRETPGTYFEAF
jgi:nucleoside phosphorylase